MATIWLTYAWEDNRNQDVDYVAQELIRAGVNVRLDRWAIGAGLRLWEQIENFIMNPSESDGWLLYATANSLGSEPCKEEFSFALLRALETRGTTFPVIGLFPSPIDHGLIPASIRNRLYVSTTDPDWKERIVAATEGRQPNIARHEIQPYFLEVHQLGENQFAIEVRPRAGVWRPFLAEYP